jgi:hypothetical protein
MRVLHLFIILIVIALIGACLVSYFDLVQVPVLSETAWKIKGYGPADTPDDALEKFNKALEDRNYKAASRYLDGDYQVQFRKQAKMAEKLGKTIDNFRSVAKDFGVNANKIEELLLVLERFPKRINTKDIKKTDDSSAVAVITSEGGSRLVGPEVKVLKLKKVEGRWVLDIPLSPINRANLDWIDRHGQNVVNAVKGVTTRMKNDAVTKENVYNDLKQELKDAFTPD